MYVGFEVNKEKDKSLRVFVVSQHENKLQPFDVEEKWTSDNGPLRQCRKAVSALDARNHSETVTDGPPGRAVHFRVTQLCN